ncbi:MAG TPA: hypothetical protein PKV80_08895 [Leptospiraceae bacterium]|nr:hypothetical protein [Leptospiraceae bacterium]
MKNITLSVFSVFIYLLISSGLSSQAAPAKTDASAAPKKETAPAVSGKTDASPSADKKEDTKPAKKETGTVTVDPQAIANTLKNTNLKHLKKLKSAFYNNAMEEKYNSAMKGYVDSTITLSERDFVLARRKFEQNYTDMNESAKSLIDKYKAVYAQLHTDYSVKVVELKIKGSGNELNNSTFEKLIAMANEQQNNAIDQASKNNHIEALYLYKKAILNLLKIPYYIERNANKNLKINERLSKNLLIDEDYYPKDHLKTYDDCMDQIYEEKEKVREKEREDERKRINSRLGKASEESPKKDAKASKDSTTKAPAPATPTEEKKPAEQPAKSVPVPEKK